MKGNPAVERGRVSTRPKNEVEGMYNQHSPIITHQLNSKDVIVLLEYPAIDFTLCLLMLLRLLAFGSL